MDKDTNAQTIEQLQLENGELRLQLAVSQAALNAIRNIHQDTLSGLGVNINNIISISLSETSAQTFLEKMKEGALIIAPNGKIVYCNAHFGGLMN